MYRRKPGVMDLIYDFPNLSTAVQQQILDGPAMEPPEGVTPDFSKPESRRVVAIAVSAVCLTLVVISSAIRLYSRLVIVKKMRLEDCRSHIHGIEYHILCSPVLLTDHCGKDLGLAAFVCFPMKSYPSSSY